MKKMFIPIILTVLLGISVVSAVTPVEKKANLPAHQRESIMSMPYFLLKINFCLGFLDSSGNAHCASETVGVCNTCSTTYSFSSCTTTCQNAWLPDTDTTTSDTVWHGFVLMFWMKDSSNSYEVSDTHYVNTPGWNVVIPCERCTVCASCSTIAGVHVWFNNFANVKKRDGTVFTVDSGDSMFVKVYVVDTMFESYTTYQDSGVYYLDSVLTPTSSMVEWKVVLIDTSVLKTTEPYFVIPEKPYLGQNTPNPFNTSTSIEYSVPGECRVRLLVTDIVGRRVKILADGFRERGRYKVVWDGTDDAGKPVPSGVYFYKFIVNGQLLDKKKMTFIK